MNGSEQWILGLTIGLLFLSEKRIVDPPPTPHSRYLVPKLQESSPSHLTLRVGLLSAEVPGRATNREKGNRRHILYRLFKNWMRRKVDCLQTRKAMEKEVVYVQ